jgi:hypothetical protein
VTGHRPWGVNVKRADGENYLGLLARNFGKPHDSFILVQKKGDNVN